jgi:hypothetical protein
MSDSEQRVDEEEATPSCRLRKRNGQVQNKNVIALFSDLLPPFDIVDLPTEDNSRRSIEGWRVHNKAWVIFLPSLLDEAVKLTHIWCRVCNDWKSFDGASTTIQIHIARGGHAQALYSGDRQPFPQDRICFFKM